MAYQLKNRTKIGAAIDNNLLEGLKALSVSTRIPLSKLLDEAIEDLLKKYNEKGQG